MTVAKRSHDKIGIRRVNPTGLFCVRNASFVSSSVPNAPLRDRLLIQQNLTAPHSVTSSHRKRDTPRQACLQLSRRTSNTLQSSRSNLVSPQSPFFSGISRYAVSTFVLPTRLTSPRDARRDHVPILCSPMWKQRPLVLKSASPRIFKTSSKGNQSKDPFRRLPV